MLLERGYPVWLVGRVYAMCSESRSMPVGGGHVQGTMRRTVYAFLCGVLGCLTELGEGLGGCCQGMGLGSCDAEGLRHGCMRWVGKG